jgi:parallel beta-helix repeat protein
MLPPLLLALIAPAAFAGDGALLGDHARVNNLRVGSNRFTGIRVESGSTLTNNTVYDNAGTGISASGGSIVPGNTVVGNDGLVQLFLNTNVP